MSLSAAFGGNPSMTIAFVNVAGIFGYSIGEKTLELLRISNPVARGVSLGTASHIMGTRRAFEMGEEEGAMGSLSIGVAGILTSFLMPLMIRLFGL
jgi:putative effector of murein hydrolase